MYLRTLRKSSAFSLVELLVVITILAILSTVAYTSFSGSTDKAKNSKRLEHLGSIETGLQMFYQEKSYYPMPEANSATNLWGYASASGALRTNTGTLTITDGNILDVTAGSGGGRVQTGALASSQVGAKGVMTQSIIGKQFLSQDIADPSSETKVGSSKTLKDFGIGRYSYAVFAKPPTTGTWGDINHKTSTTAFNIAATILDDQKGQVAKVSGNFDDKFTGCAGLTCPASLIGSETSTIKDGDTAALPYAIKY